MDNKILKKIVLKKEAISNLNNSQMNDILGGRYASANTLNGNTCINCGIQDCTMYEDCKSNDCATRVSCDTCGNIATCVTCDVTCLPTCTGPHSCVPNENCAGGGGY